MNPKENDENIYDDHTKAILGNLHKHITEEDDLSMNKVELLKFIETMQETLERQHQMMIEATRHDLVSQHITPATAIGQLLSYGVNNLKIVELFAQWGITQQ